MPAFAPVMTAKFRACTSGPPAKAYNPKNKNYQPEGLGMLDSNEPP
jgi:hypothetical protein